MAENMSVSSEKDPLVSERSGTVREVGNNAIWSLSSCKPGRLRIGAKYCTQSGNPTVRFKLPRISEVGRVQFVFCGAVQWLSMDSSDQSLQGFGIDQLRDDCMDTYWQSDGQLPHLVNIQFQRKTMVSHIYIYTDYKLDESYTPSRVSVRAGTHFNDLQEIEVIELIEPTGWVMIPIKDIHDRPIRTYMIQIAVISNHQNGRDTHMRQIKVHSPCEPASFGPNKFGSFSTVQFQQYATIR